MTLSANRRARRLLTSALSRVEYPAIKTDELAGNIPHLVIVTYPVFQSSFLFFPICADAAVDK